MVRWGAFPSGIEAPERCTESAQFNAKGGGYYDSGYIQPVDFFGDGTRIPLLIVSPFSTGGKVNHSYSDHVSLVKFIERNWNLKPLTGRSRDNLPNPKAAASNPYVPTNSPAIGDLFDAFDFSHEAGLKLHANRPGRFLLGRFFSSIRAQLCNTPLISLS